MFHHIFVVSNEIYEFMTFDLINSIDLVYCLCTKTWTISNAFQQISLLLTHLVDCLVWYNRTNTLEI